MAQMYFYQNGQMWRHLQEFVISVKIACQREMCILIFFKCWLLNISELPLLYILI